ncbi:MAG: DUF6242 domain-containing protein [Dysgonamonadaceae bacterium]|jgi:hypothetical protein|nr:DUF6242 domain-containing protein [Dysgonamonadaceae bacterium]
MTSKYIFQTALSVLSIVLFISCLGGSSAVDIEPSRDAQIYAFSMEAHRDADSARLLPATRFTIDQVNGRIFNQVFLPYQFSVDSVVLSIGGSQASLRGLSEVKIHLINPDSSFTLNRNDSIYISRLAKIETTAEDGKNQKTYDFQLNIYQQDPFIISWTRLSNAYLPSPIQAQKTIELDKRFITYYTAGGAISATYSTDGVNWTNSTLTGLPATTQLSLITSSNNAAYVIDDANNVYKTTDGLNWSAVATSHPVVTIYGVLPSSTGGRILIVVNDNGTLKFAQTDDFSTITLKNELPSNIVNNIPMAEFSATQIDRSTTSYSVRYIVLAGGVTRNGLLNSNNIWILHENSGAIQALDVQTSMSLQGSSLFFYDDRLYALVTTPDGKNTLMFSKRYGLEWTETGEDQTFPDNFTYRTYASVITDTGDYIWMFGGRTPVGEFSDAWRGRLNRLDEEDR